jgi:hypothetical protein
VTLTRREPRESHHLIKRGSKLGIELIRRSAGFLGAILELLVEECHLLSQSFLEGRHLGGA